MQREGAKTAGGYLSQSAAKGVGGPPGERGEAPSPRQLQMMMEWREKEILVG